MTQAKKTLFSGIKPTGEIHLGNYLGALKNWVDLQDEYNCFYSIVDLHGITIDYQPREYQETILNFALDLLAIGLDPKKSNFFIQSHIPEHTELCWLFNTLIPVSELERMTQFKDKAKQHQENINAGLFDYPVLMAADILLYHATVVPIGEDQLQHLELTNTIVRKFNNKYSAIGRSASPRLERSAELTRGLGARAGGGEYFKEVKPIIGQGARIMSLADPAKKMSKSLGPNHYIALMDSPEVIKKKIMGAVTDAGPNDEIMSAGVKNLFTILELLADQKTYQKFLLAYNNKMLKYAELKSELAEIVISYLRPIQEKKSYWQKNPGKVKKILNQGAKKAQKIAQKNIGEIKKLMGLA